MSAQPARRASPQYRSSPSRPTRRRATDQAGRRRRQRHLRRLRRDLLEDLGLAVLVTITALIVTAGLGVIALLEVPVAGAIVGSFLIERRIGVRRRRSTR